MNACRAQGIAGALAAWLLLSVQPAFAETLGQTDADDISLWRVASALVFCLVLAVAAAFLLRARLTGWGVALLPSAARRLRLVETLRLSSHATIAIVACDDREVLVLISQTGAHVVDQLPRPQDGAAP